MEKELMHELRIMRLNISRLRFKRKLNDEQLKRFNKNKRIFIRNLSSQQIEEIRELFKEVMQGRAMTHYKHMYRIKDGSTPIYKQPPVEIEISFSWDGPNHPRYDS